MSSPDEYSGLPDAEPIMSDIDSLKLYDQKIVNLKPEEKIQAVNEIEKIALSDPRIKKSSGASYGTNKSEFIIANSKGFSGIYNKTSCSAGVYLQAGTDDNMVEDGWYSSAKSLDMLKDNEYIAKRAVSNVTRLIGAKKVKTQNVPVVMVPEMTARILGFLSQCVSGGAIYMKQSFLAGKLGEKIAIDGLNVFDDGLMPDGVNSKPFDSEGVPTRRKPVIENGTLKNYLLDTYSAKKLNMKSTGNAGGVNNLYLEAGNYSPEEIIKSVKNGMLLVKTLGQGTVPVSGDLSTGAFGIWIENGELTYPVAEITINGNLADMLKNIEMIGSDLTFDRAITGPTIKIGSMSIAGI
jgi:PmbA protein